MAMDTKEARLNEYFFIFEFDHSQNLFVFYSIQYNIIITHKEGLWRNLQPFASTPQNVASDIANFRLDLKAW